MKIIYTTAAHEQLAVFQARQKELLEEIISNRKSIYGDDVLEITASDIKEASGNFRAVSSQKRRLYFTVLVTRLYVALGIVIMLGSLGYPLIIEALERNKMQVLVFLMGAFLASIGAALGYLMKFRQKQLEEDLLSMNSGALQTKSTGSEMRDDAGKI